MVTYHMNKPFSKDCKDLQLLDSLATETRKRFGLKALKIYIDQNRIYGWFRCYLTKPNYTLKHLIGFVPLAC